MPTGTASKTAAERLEIAENNARIIAALSELGGKQFTVDQGVTYHEDKNDKRIVLPQGMDPATGANALMDWAQAQKETVSVERTFECSPGDGAFCFQTSLKQIFGIAGVGKPIRSFFGESLPETIEVRTGVGANDLINAPWGRLAVAPLEGSIYLLATRHEKLGWVFQVNAEVPKKFEAAINGLYKVVEETIVNQSIYIGKSFQGVGLDIKTPERAFLDPFKVNRHEVVYADDVFRILSAEVWGVIENADLLQSAGQPINTKHLLYGPYGTGKTLALQLTAQVAVDNGWTFMQCNVGDDDIEQVVRWAKIYARGNKGVVVAVEDIDVLIDTDAGENREKMSRMMDLFDGFDSKNNRVMMLMTSNHLEAFDAPFTRQGRFDNLIEVAALDKKGVEKLLHALFKPEQLEKTLDFDAIYTAMLGYEPAFIRGTFNRVLRSSIVRTGKIGQRLSTEDFVVAATALRKQWEIHSAKKDEVKPERSLDKYFRDMMIDAFVDRIGIDTDYDPQRLVLLDN